MQKSAPAKYIIYWCINRYLTPEQIMSLKKDFGKSVTNQKKFLQTLMKYFDIERLHTNPIHPLDFLVYNYLIYDYKGRLTKTKLLKRYEKEVMNT